MGIIAHSLTNLFIIYRNSEFTYIDYDGSGGGFLNDGNMLGAHKCLSNVNSINQLEIDEFIPCFKPGISFEVYGVPLSAEGDEGCTKETYINSLYSTNLSPWINAVVQSGGMEAEPAQRRLTGDAYPSSFCSITATDIDNDMAASPFRSEGAACVDNTLVHATFSGPSCLAANRLDTMESGYYTQFNEGLSQLECAKIYDSQEGSAYYGDADDMTLLDLLYNSYACALDASGGCSDTFGIKKMHTNNFKAALGSTSSKVSLNTTARIANSAGFWTFLVSLFLVLQWLVR